MLVRTSCCLPLEELHPERNMFMCFTLSAKLADFYLIEQLPDFFLVFFLHPILGFSGSS